MATEEDIATSIDTLSDCVNALCNIMDKQNQILNKIEGRLNNIAMRV